MRTQRGRGILAATAGVALLGVLALAAAANAAPSKSSAGGVTAKVEHRTLTIVGNDDSNQIVLRLDSQAPKNAGHRNGALQVDAGNDGSADFQFQLHRFDSIVVDAGGGDDVVAIDDANGTFTDSKPTTLSGGAGNDTLLGGAGPERLIGGDGNDFVDGNAGTDSAFLGAGDDTFRWDPGDGSDVIEGQDGNDTMLFNGSNAAEKFSLAAVGPRLRFTRDVGNITMDTDGIEKVQLNALGGADTVTENDLAGTAVADVDADLGAGDGQADQVIVNGTKLDDGITVAGGPSGVTIAGLAARVSIAGSEPGDALTVDGLGANDRIDASKLAAGAIGLTLDGDAGDDALAGSAGSDVILGGDGSDSIIGNQGADHASMGAGDDTFVWNPGDGSDIIEGQDGNDTMLFNGSDGAEKFSLAAVGHRLRFTRDVGNITMDTDGIERVKLNALGGADSVTENDLTGTAVRRVAIDLGSGDDATDSVVVDGTASNDRITVAGDDTGVSVDGLAAQVTINHAEPTDQLTVAALAGDDAIDASGLAAGAISLTLDGGPGNNVIVQ
jgi:Ca2+-binding RTX toxin-like protein